MDSFVILVVMMFMLGMSHAWHSEVEQFRDPESAGHVAYVLNSKNNCWWTCKGGPCTKICGHGGYCCRKGWKGCPSDMTAIAPPNYHTCIKYKQAVQVDNQGTVKGRVAYVLNSKNNCWWTCKGGPCTKICGSGGYCCRKGWKGCPSDMTAIAPTNYHTCIKYKQDVQVDNQGNEKGKWYCAVGLLGVTWMLQIKTKNLKEAEKKMAMYQEAGVKPYLIPFWGSRRGKPFTWVGKARTWSKSDITKVQNLCGTSLEGDSTQEEKLDDDIITPKINDPVDNMEEWTMEQ